MTERPNAVKLMGNAFTLVGPELNVGSKAPDFEMVGKDLKPVGLGQTRGKVRIFSVVPSIDTPVCDAQTRRFNQEAASLSDVQIYTISMDLPFAQSRWCAAAGVDKVTMLSDFQKASFGTSYGTLIKELHLECRALFVLDENDVVRHVEYVENTGSHPDYEAALQVARQLSGA